jgi:hypothetical protein
MSRRRSSKTRSVDIPLESTGCISLGRPVNAVVACADDVRATDESEVVAWSPIETDGPPEAFGCPPMAPVSKHAVDT